MPQPGPLTLYRQALKDGFTMDSGQEQAVIALQQCFDALKRGERPAGLYLWGPVGRGKTWLMDQFHHSLSVPVRRQHFHHFMQWVHRRLFQLTGHGDPLHHLARELAGELRVLCFDELFVSDIGDAMLLGPLFETLIDAGLTLIITSNCAPEHLYQDGFNYDRFAPAVSALQQHLKVIRVDGGQDHRLRAGNAFSRYWIADREPLEGAFLDYLETGESATDTPWTLERRLLPVVRRGKHALWSTFAQLCETPRSSSDYMALCGHFQALFLSDVPALGGKPKASGIARGTEDAASQVAAGDRALPALSRHDDAVRRLIALVDECYDRLCPLYVHADVSLDRLYTEGHLILPFQRTVSRLHAMQTWPHPSSDPGSGQTERLTLP
tara:strand:+ start:599 stop:1744 length:1146 start_codon:yes stop_codon:yes gene_type:complete